MISEWIATIRDVVIIFMGAGTFVLVALLIFIAWKAYKLMGFIRSKTEELSAVGRTVLESARQTAETAGETATTVKGSAEFVSDTVVAPVVQVVSAVAGARSFVAALFRLPGSGRNGEHR